MTSLAGKVAIITGAASGIGQAGGEVFLAAGAKLVLVDRDKERLNAVVAQIGGSDGVRACYADITREQDCQAMVDLAVETFGRLDVLWNNAGITGAGQVVGELSLEAWQRVIDVNLTGVFLGMRAALPVMVRQQGGSIINTASVAGQVVFAGDAAYCASKAGVIMLTKTAAVEYARLGIRVNCVLPGLIDTPMFAGLPHLQARVDRVVPFGRLGNPAEIARAACFLASDESSYVTGEALTVDGGYTLR